MRSPTLREIARMGNAEYQACLSLFLTTAKDLICASLHLVSGEDFDKLRRSCAGRPPSFAC